MKIIDLTQGIGCLVDDDQFFELSQYSWYAARRGRQWVASRNIQLPGKKNQSTINMQQMILPAPSGFVADHKQHHEFWIDNRRSNLRLATRHNNGHNSRKQLRGTSKYKGVSWKKEFGMWQACIKPSGVQHHLGYYESEEDAAHVYDYAARAYFGEFALLNFPA